MHRWAMMVALTLLAACSDNNEADKNAGANNAAGSAEQVETARQAMAITPGLWETQIRFKDIEAKGMPDTVKSQMMKATGGLVTVKSCITKDQVEKPDADFFGAAKGSNCTFDRMVRSGAKLDVAMTCKPDGKTVIKNTMSGSFGDNSYSMDMQQQTTGTPMGDINMTGTISAKRLGDCPS